MQEVLVRKAPKHGLYTGEISSMIVAQRGPAWPEPIDEHRIQQSSRSSDIVLHEAFYGTKTSAADAVIHFHQHQRRSQPSMLEDISSLTFEGGLEPMIFGSTIEEVSEFASLDAIAAEAAAACTMDSLAQLNDETFGIEC
jgi:hypothetical protein